jgi:hypothetical protein
MVGIAALDKATNESPRAAQLQAPRRNMGKDSDTPPTGINQKIRLFQSQAT